MLMRVLQTLANGVLITRLKRLASKNDSWQAPPALKVCVTTGLSRKEVERAGATIRHAITKVMSKKK